MKENKMATMPIGKLLFTMAFPIIISMFIQALYYIVDAYFVGKINEEAFTAVSMALPIQTLIIAIAVGTGVGMNALLSRNLGEGNYKSANASAENGLFLAVVYGLIFFVLSFFVPEIFYKSQTGQTQIINYGVEYLSIVMRFSVFVFVQICAERMLAATGRSVHTMITQSLGALINIILDPIFIFGLGPIPAMGIRGAAIATVIGPFAGSAIGLSLNFLINSDLVIKKVAFDRDIIKKIYVVGIPSIVVIAINSITIYFINKILFNFSTSAVAAYAAYIKVQNFAFMPVFGLVNGMVPIVAYNYGAKNSRRMKDTIKKSAISVFLMMSFSTFLFQMFPTELLKFFSASGQMIEIGIPAFRRISLCLIFAGFSIVGGSVFQALGNGTLSLIDSVLRQIVILIPYFYIFSLIGNVDNVWWGYLLAETASIFYVLYYMKKFALPRINSANS